MECYGLSIVGASGVNGDKYFVSIDKNVFAISDGASGAYDKVEASSNCIKPLEDLGYEDSKLSASDYIDFCFREANEKLIEISRIHNKLSFATMTMCVFDSGVLYTGMVGDTLAFLIRGDNISRLCIPKKRYSRAVECGVLTEEEAEKAIEALPGPMRSAYETFLPMIIPSIAKSEVKILKSDILFICCDGITDWIEQEELVQFFNSPKSLDEICSDILKKVEEKCPSEWLDDRTIVAVRF